MPDSSPARVNSGHDLPLPAPAPGRLHAAQISYQGGMVMAQGAPGQPVLFESGSNRLYAQSLTLDTVNGLADAQGAVRSGAHHFHSAARDAAERNPHALSPGKFR